MAFMLRAVARAMMPAFIKQGVSAGAFRRRLIRQFGSAYRWQVLLGDYREFSGMQRFESAVKSLRPSAKPSPTIMTELRMRRERRYRGIGRATYRNLETGEEYTQNISMYDDKFDSKQAFTDTFIEDKRKAEYKPEYEIVSIDWYVIQHNEGWSY